MKGIPTSKITSSSQYKSIQYPIILFLVLWAVLGIWMPLVRVKIFPHQLNPEFHEELYKGVQENANIFLEPWQRWDTLHYQAIAERGYTAFDTALFTPPLYPLTMGFVSRITHLNTLVSGLLISNLAYLGALIALYRLVFFETDDIQTAKRTILYLALFPTSFFFMGGFSESLFLLSVILLVTFIRQKKWKAAGLLGGIAAITRITGIILPLPLGLISLKEITTKRNMRSLWIIAGTVGGLALFPMYVWLVMGQSPLLILEALNSRGGNITWPGLNVVKSIELLFHGTLPVASVFDLILTIVFACFAVPVFTKLPKIYGYYYLTLLIFYLMRLGPGTQPLLGMTRYVLILFPAFMIMGKMGNNPWFHRLVIYPSIILLLLFSSIFASWGVI